MFVDALLGFVVIIEEAKSDYDDVGEKEEEQNDLRWEEMVMMNPIAVIKVTFEGAFDVFLELCREYCGQFRSHLSNE